MKTKRWYSKTHKCWARTCPSCGGTILHQGKWSLYQSKHSFEQGTKCMKCRFENRRKPNVKPSIKPTTTKPVVRKSPDKGKWIHSQYVVHVFQKLTDYLTAIDGRLIHVEKLQKDMESNTDRIGKLYTIMKDYEKARPVIIKPAFLELLQTATNALNAAVEKKKNATAFHVNQRVPTTKQQ